MHHPVPHHLAIIPDGNRRYAKAHGLTVAEGYLMGLDKVVETVRWWLEKGVRHVSAYAASQENVVRRPQLEMLAVFHAVEQFFVALESTPGVHVHVFGDLENLPKWTPNRQKFLDRQDARPDDTLTVHIGLNYSGSAEIPFLLAQAERYGTVEVAASPEKYMLSRGVPPIDLVIRSGGQRRLSGFLPYQTLYSELWFIEKYWPEIEIPDMQESFEWYAKQPRNFGK